MSRILVATWDLKHVKYKRGMSQRKGQKRMQTCNETGILKAIRGGLGNDGLLQFLSHREQYRRD